VLAASSTHELPDGGILSVLAQQAVRDPAGRLMVSWVLQRTRPGTQLAAQQLYPLLGRLQQILVVSSGWLPQALVTAMLHAGCKAVVCAVAPAAVAEVEGGAVGAFFQRFYRGVLAEAAPVAAALAAAEGDVPELAGCYCLHHL
jgi:hypothetical protein